MMFLSSFLNEKVNLAAGMAIGVGMAMIFRKVCKKKSQLATRNTATQKQEQ